MQAAATSAVVSSVQSIMGAATGIQATMTAPVMDQRFTEYVPVESSPTMMSIRANRLCPKGPAILLNGPKTTSKQHIRR